VAAALDALRDAWARVARLLEAFNDGDFELVQLIGEDIEHDLAAVIELYDRGVLVPPLVCEMLACVPVAGTGRRASSTRSQGGGGMSVYVSDESYFEHHERLLTLAAESYDRAAQAREALAEQGLT
jgi:hypothetical protein